MDKKIEIRNELVQLLIDRSLTGDNYETMLNDYSERIVKLFAIHDVVWRSEQLKAYAEFLSNTPAFQNYSNKDLAINYCDSL